MGSRWIVAICTIGVAIAGSAAAQDISGKPPGRVVARSFAALPTPIVVAVEVLDNTDENMALQRRFTDELARRGAKIEGKEAPLAFVFATEVRRNVPAGSRPDLSRESSSLPDGDAERVTNLLSSTRESVLRSRPERPVEYERALRYVINATIDDRRDGRRLWQGHISYDGAQSDRMAAFNAMVARLVEQVGKNLQESGFRLD